MTEEQLQQTTKSSKWLNIGILFSTLGVIVLIGLIYFVFMRFGMLYENLSLTTTELKNKTAQTEVLSANLQQQLQQVTDDVTKQAQSIADLRQTLGKDPERWRILEAHYLVKLANDHLQFSQNASLALKLLQNADDEIKKLNNPNLQEIRKALASDIAHLQSIQQVNVEEMYLQLVGLNEKIDQLPLLMSQVSQQNQNGVKQDLSQFPWWKKGLYQTWNTLQKIVVVQHDTTNHPPIVLPTQREYIYQNLHAQLETAIWGLLHNQPTVYQTSLTQLSNWIKRYYMQDSSLTQSALTTIATLQKATISAHAVSIMDSLQAFQQYFQSQDVRVKN